MLKLPKKEFSEKWRNERMSVRATLLKSNRPTQCLNKSQSFSVYCDCDDHQNRRQIFALLERLGERGSEREMKMQK